MGKRSSRYRLASIILVKLGLVALLLVLPAKLAISFGAAHVVVLAVVLVSAAVLVGLRHAVRSHR